MNNNITTKQPVTLKDTYFLISWLDFINIAKKYGFKEGYSSKFISENNKPEEEVIFFHEEKGLILYACSYSNILNCASVYGEIKAKNKNSYYALNGCSFGGNKNGTIHFSVDVRENLKYKLDKISDAFNFSKTWTQIPFLWFLNFMDTKSESYDYKEITKNKIESCSNEVKHIIYG